MAPNHVIGKKNLLTQGFCGSHISNGLVIYGSRGSKFLTRVLHNGDFRLTKCSFYKIDDKNSFFCNKKPFLSHLDTKNSVHSFMFIIRLNYWCQHDSKRSIIG